MKHLLITIALFAAATAWADTECITDIMVIGGTKAEVNNMKDTYTAQGWSVIDKDLNTKCGDGTDWIFLLYKKGTVEAAGDGNYITDFYISDSKYPPATVVCNGMEFCLVPYDGGSHFKNVKGDLNSGAEGSYIHLYYSKQSTGFAVSSITFDDSSTGAVCKNGGTDAFDLNEGAGGEYIYMHSHWANEVDLSKVTDDYQAKDGEVLTGTLEAKVKISIDPGATVALKDITIEGVNWAICPWAAITCEGSATLVISGVNSVKGFQLRYPGIQASYWGSTLTIRGNGTLNATSQLWGAGIGSSSDQMCGDIVIDGGIINATSLGRSANGQIIDYGAGAGIGSAQSSRCGNITISGGTVNATSDGKLFIGIGAGKSGSCSDITITRGVTRVTANKADGEPNSIGKGQGGDCGTVTIGGKVYPDGISESPYTFEGYLLGAGTSDDPYLIENKSDWQRFTTDIDGGKKADKYYKLTADLDVACIVNGTFRGHFDGDGHTLTFSINSGGDGVAPFHSIDGATIENLTVCGTITSCGDYTAGLVGKCGATAANTIRSCTVSANVNGPTWSGGIVGHGGEGKLVLEDCIYEGTISGFAAHAGGLMGWCNALDLQITDCLFNGAFVPADGGKYHPIACKYEKSTVTATVSGAYYIYTAAPTATGDNVIPGAEGIAVSDTPVNGIHYGAVTTTNGNTFFIVEEAAYYVWLTYATDGQGTLQIPVRKGRQALAFAAAEGWKVDALTVNGTDRLADLSDGKLVVDIDENTEVSVTYAWADADNMYTEDKFTGIAAIEGTGIKVYVKNGQLCIDGAADREVRLYTVGGLLLKTVTPSKDMTGKFAVPTGTYIVQVGDKAAKITVE